ncbi:MAG: complex I subunit 5 family protein [Candidatus Methanosuratincola sp.]|nr:proton-conducting transporter membrane subunit [Candidatus Methanosuratincola sp.]
MVSDLPVYIPLLPPLAGAVILTATSSLYRRRHYGVARWLISILSLLASLLLLILLLPSMPSSWQLGAYGPPAGSCLRLDPLSAFLCLTAVSVTSLSVAFSYRYMEHDRGKNRYYSLMLLLTAGLLGVFVSGDLFTLFVFWELMCVSSYALVAFRKHEWEPLEAGFKYLVMSTVGSLVALYGISLVYGIAGTLEISGIGTALSGAGMTGYFPLAMIVAGFGVTAAIVPFHTWLPDAHPAAPSPVSAVLSGLVIKGGAYAIFRVLFTGFASFSFGVPLMVLGAITMTLGNLMVFAQQDIKRFFAFSSVANMGLILLAGGAAAQIAEAHPAAAGLACIAMAGALFHILNHALGKSLLFLSSGSMIHSAGTRSIQSLEGIARRMPWSGGALTVGLLSLAGVPPLGGFWSKLMVLAPLAALLASGDPAIATAFAVVLVNSLLAAGYYIWLAQRIAFKPTAVPDTVGEPPASMLIPVLILSLICIGMAFALPWLIPAFEAISRSLVGGVIR